MTPPAAVNTAPPLTALDHDFDHAADASGGVSELFVAFARRPVCIRFGGPRVAAALRPALAHLETAPGERPALTLRVWDALRPSAAPEPGAAEEATAAGVGASYFYERDGFRALHQPSSDILSVLGPDGASGWFWMPDASGLPYWEYTAPFRHLLSWWLRANGLHHVHGAAVGTAAGGVLIAGPGGAGKSTTALASLLDGRLGYAGDDYVAVGLDAPFVHSLYSSAKIHRDDLPRFPHLDGVVGRDGREDGKAVFYVGESFPGRAVPGFPLRAIVVPRVGGRRAARAVRGASATALAALAPSTIFQLHPPAPDALARMAELARAVPTFVLELGTDIRTIPRELLRIIDEGA